MAAIDLVGVSFAHSDSHPLLSNVTLQLSPGWSGIVGANGVGKTTLLSLLSGDLEPDAGSVRLRAKRRDVRLCPQRVGALSPEIEAFAASAVAEAHRLRGKLRLDASALRDWATLSPGERKRWQIAAALCGEPPVLLLDEPTNHLDGEAHELLESALGRYRGVGVIVSHDRGLLTRLTSRTLRMRNAMVSVYRGAYDEARRQWESDERSEHDTRQRLRSEQRKLERRLHDRRDKRASAEARASTRGRMKNARDSDARLRFKQTRRRSAENALGREVEKIHHDLDRVGAEVRRHRTQKALGRTLFVDHALPAVPLLLALDADRLLPGGATAAHSEVSSDEAAPLLRDLHVQLRRDGRVHLRGPNGSGKTTLLERLVADTRIPPERVLYLPQELDKCALAELPNALRDLVPSACGRLMGLVAALGVAPDALLGSQRFSPGEARKLSLAMGLARQVWLLVLDEPTNHLDLPSIERLEESLADYPGAILVVSHDEAFAARITHTRWTLQEGRLVVSSRQDSV